MLRIPIANFYIFARSRRFNGSNAKCVVVEIFPAFQGLG